MKKLAVLLGLSGAFLTAQADMTRTFEGWDMAAGDCESATDSYGNCMLFEYGTEKLDLIPSAGGFGAGQVLKVDYVLDGDWASAGVGVAFTTTWDAVDASALTAVKLTLRTDKVRDVEIALKTNEDLDPAYQALGTGGISYMATKEVDETGTTLTIPVASFVFPTWWKDKATAGDVKEAAQTWVGSKLTTDMVAKRVSVLKQLVTIQIAIPCREGEADLRTCDADAGTLEIDDVTLVGVKDAEGLDLIEGEQSAAVLPRSASAHGLRTAINGQLLTVGRAESSSATLELIRLDGSKVSSWAISGATASVALPAGLEKGTYYAVVSSEGKRSSSSVSIVR